MIQQYECKEKLSAGHSKGLTGPLPYVTKTEFLLTTSIQYQEDK